MGHWLVSGITFREKPSSSDPNLFSGRGGDLAPKQHAGADKGGNDALPMDLVRASGRGEPWHGNTRNATKGLLSHEQRCFQGHLQPRRLGGNEAER